MFLLPAWLLLLCFPPAFSEDCFQPRIRGGGILFRQNLDKNLHSTSQAKNKVKYWLFLDVVVAQSCFPATMIRGWRPRRMPSLSWMFLFTFSILSLGSTSRVLVFPVRVFTKNCMMLPNLYCFSRNKQQKLSLFKVRKRNGVEGNGCYSSVVMAVGRGIFCFAILLLFPAVFRLYNTFMIR